MPDLNYLWQYILTGDWIGFVEAVFTNTLGSLFYGFIILFMIVGLYMRTQSASYVAILWMIAGSFYLAMLPVGAWKIAGPLLVLSIGGLFFYLFTKVRG